VSLKLAWLYSKFETNLNYTVRSCFKKQTKKTKQNKKKKKGKMLSSVWLMPITPANWEEDLEDCSWKQAQAKS
jgi:hypothetical protein